MELFGAGAAIGFVMLIMGIFLIPAIFFLLTQQNTLKAIQPQNRTMSPGEVWLQLIPLFNLVWCFIVVGRISESIRRELAYNQAFSFEQNNTASYYESTERPTHQVGMAMCILNVCSIIPILGTFAGLAAIICWIIYWVKLAEYKNMILSRSYLYNNPVAPTPAPVGQAL